MIILLRNLEEYDPLFIPMNSLSFELEATPVAKIERKELRSLKEGNRVLFQELARKKIKTAGAAED